MQRLVEPDVPLRLRQLQLDIAMAASDAEARTALTAYHSWLEGMEGVTRPLMQREHSQGILSMPLRAHTFGLRAQADAPTLTLETRAVAAKAWALCLRRGLPLPADALVKLMGPTSRLFHSPEISSSENFPVALAQCMTAAVGNTSAPAQGRAFFDNVATRALLGSVISQALDACSAAASHRALRTACLQLVHACVRCIQHDPRVLAAFFPGLVTGLARIAAADWKQGHRVTTLALSTLTLCLQEQSPQQEEEEEEEGQQQLYGGETSGVVVGEAVGEAVGDAQDAGAHSKALARLRLMAAMGSTGVARAESATASSLSPSTPIRPSAPPSGEDAFRVEVTMQWWHATVLRLHAVLQRLFACMRQTYLEQRPDWRIREACAAMAAALARHCWAHVAPLRPLVVDALLVASQDEWEPVRRPAAQAMERLRRRHRAAVTPLLRQALQAALTALPRVLRGGAHEGQQLAALARVRGAVECMGNAHVVRYLQGHLAAVVDLLLQCLTVTPHVHVQDAFVHPHRAAQHHHQPQLHQLAAVGRVIGHAPAVAEPSQGTAASGNAASLARLFRPYTWKWLASDACVAAAASLCALVGRALACDAPVLSYALAYLVDLLSDVDTLRGQPQLCFLVQHLVTGVQNGCASDAAAAGEAVQQWPALLDSVFRCFYADELWSLPFASEPSGGGRGDEGVVVGDGRALAANRLSTTAAGRGGGAVDWRGIYQGHGALTAPHVWNPVTPYVDLTRTTTNTTATADVSTYGDGMGESVYPVPLSPSHNVVLQRMAMQAVAHLSALVSPMDVRDRLMYLAYPLLEKVGCPHVELSADAWTTLHLVALACGYGDAGGEGGGADDEAVVVSPVARLVQHNVDYVVDDICRRIDELQAYPLTPYVLDGILMCSDEGVIPVLEDTMDGIMNGLDTYQGNDIRLEGLLLGILRRVASVLCSVSKTWDHNKSDEADVDSVDDDSIVDDDDDDIEEDAETYFRKRLASMDGGEEGGDDDDVMDPDQRAEARLDANVVRCVSYAQRIVDKMQHYVAHTELGIQLKVMDTIADCMSVMVPMERILLPSIHTCWDPLVLRLNANNALTAARAWHTLCAMVQAAGDFVSGRLPPLWLQALTPTTRLRLLTLVVEATPGRRTAAAAPTLGPRLTLQSSVLHAVGCMGAHCRIAGPVCRRMLRLTAPAFDRRAPVGVQREAVQAWQALGANHNNAEAAQCVPSACRDMLQSGSLPRDGGEEGEQDDDDDGDGDDEVKGVSWRWNTQLLQQVMHQSNEASKG